MPKKALTEHQKDRVYQLCVEDGISQSKVAAMYEVSQSTVSNAIKDKRHEAEVAQLQKNIQNAAAYGVKAAVEERLITPEIPLEYLEVMEDMYGRGGLT
ncbi:MAG: hypothetical protein K2H82_00255 [Oscillospiraceae bacterium]|nr:hypothetical protein [Oscillospiraceae bacterium]